MNKEKEKDSISAPVDKLYFLSLLLLHTSLAPMTVEIYICSGGRRIGLGTEGDEYFRNNGQIVQNLTAISSL